MAGQVITITDRAATQIKQLMASRGKPSAGIKVLVATKGCSGLKYQIEYADELSEYDEVVDDKEVRVVIDPMALMHIIGSEMDYVEEKFRSGFVFNNPNAKGQCGCGESFYT